MSPVVGSRGGPSTARPHGVPVPAQPGCGCHGRSGTGTGCSWWRSCATCCWDSASSWLTTASFGCSTWSGTSCRGRSSPGVSRTHRARAAALGALLAGGQGFGAVGALFPGTEPLALQRQWCSASASTGRATPARSSGTWSLPSMCCSGATSRCSPSAASSSPWSPTTTPTSAWVTGGAAPSAC